MKIRALLLGVVTAAVLSLTPPAGAVLYPHGPHDGPEKGGSGCLGFPIHQINTSSYATTARYSFSTCTQLGVRLRCRNLVGTLLDTGYQYTANGTATSTTVTINNSCESLYDSGHKWKATSGTTYTYTFSS